jgi:Raf kinase inhibitor-like YbhB/YbcL family protein
MKLHSDSFEHRGPIPPAFAMGRKDGAGDTFSDNRNPHLAWSEAPADTQSFALLCIDPDAPTVAEMVGKPGVEIPVEQPRGDFAHWVMVDIPPDVRGFEEGAWSNGITAGGKSSIEGPHRARSGLNDYTGWFADDATMGGNYRGYDGPFPPSNDLRLHRYFFRLFALDAATLDLPERFGAGDVLRAINGHVLAEALIYGTYSLHPRLQPK